MLLSTTMGNCFVLFKPRESTIHGAAAARHERVLQSVKGDGKISGCCKSAMLVKDQTMEFSGFSFSREALQPLPPNSPSGANGTKRIKVIITKKQLKELLSQKVSVEEILSGLQKDALTRWRPLLETIPEGSDYW